MIILPAIDLKGGRCVRLRQGREDQATVYSDDPLATARRWVAEGARTLHVVDLDGAFQGRPAHRDVILRIAAAVPVPVEAGGGLRTDEDIRALLDGGVARAIVGTRILQDPAALGALVRAFGARLAVGIDARNGLVQVKGWTETTGVRTVDLAARADSLGAATLIVTDTATDGMLQGPNLASIDEVCARVRCGVIASGGVTTADDVRALARLGRANLEGAIVGKALYEGRVTLAELNAAAAEGGRPGVLMDVKTATLDNGVRVITSAMPGVESVSLGLWVGAGGRHEARRRSGIGHFMEHLAFKGTRRRTARELSCAIEGRGGDLNAFTQEDCTCYFARVAVDQTARAADVLADMVLDPRLAPADIEKERGVIVEEILMYRDQPQQLVQEMLGEAVWRDHPLGRSVCGTPETVGGIDRAALREFRRRHYRPNNMLCAFAGKLDHGRCVEIAGRLLGRERPGPLPACRPVTRAVGQERMARKAKDIEQVHVALGLRLFGRRDPRRYALRLLNAVLGENMSSRLFQVVRERHGLAYSIQSSFHLFDESGMWVVSAGLDRKRYLRAVELIVREMARVRDGAVGPRELRQAKDFVIGQTRLGLESTSQQMMWIAESLLAHGRQISPEEAIRAVSRLTAEDLLAVAAGVTRPARASLAMIGPGLGAEDERRLREIVGGL